MSAVPGVDWRVVRATARMLTPAGPDLPRNEAAAAVADLRACAARATEAVAAASALPGPVDAAVLVVDREGWVQAASSMAEAMLGGVGQAPLVTLGERVGGRLAGAQLGAAFAFVGTRILGQFDPYSPQRRLLLVAPNIVAVERAMGVEPHGFRQWVCLHEETHRFQFGAAPWLAGHLLGLMAVVFDDSGADARRGLSLLSPGQASGVDEITAVMSLLEGHADVMMDAADAGLVPQVTRLRAAVEARRDAPGWFQFLSRVLGLRAKREQYLHGATFCRAVIAAAGVESLNVAFTAPEALPTPAELHDPQRWLNRVPARVG